MLQPPAPGPPPRGARARGCSTDQRGDHTMDRIARRLPALGSLALLAAAALPGAARAFSGGPPDGFAGDPPAMFNCTLCHLDFPVNSGDGSLQLLGLPAAYMPGANYNLTVRLADPGQQRWGFELTAIDATINAAGTFTLTDFLRTQLSDNPGTDPDYVKHTSVGADWGTPNGPTTWSFTWTAPLAGDATFYLAGNAADGTEDPGFDYIYTLVRTVPPQSVAVANATWSAVKAIYGAR